jgi:hypothetical protein
LKIFDLIVFAGKKKAKTSLKFTIATLGRLRATAG